MNFKMIAVAAAFVAAGTAHAAVDKMKGVTETTAGNSSVFLVMLDSTGSTTRGITVDLGVNFSDFAVAGGAGNPQTVNGQFIGPNTSIHWDFAGNTMTVNGTIMTSSAQNAWGGEVADFLAAANSNEIKWAIAAGAAVNTSSGASSYLTTGTPSASQLTNQNGSKSAAMIQAEFLFTDSATRGTHATADNGAYEMGATDVGYVGTRYNLTNVNGWLNNTAFTTWNVLGAQTNLWQLNGNGSERAVGDTTTYVGGAAAYDVTGLTNAKGTFKVAADGQSAFWNTATVIPVTPSVPEPESYALALIGLAAMVVARRRVAK